MHGVNGIPHATQMGRMLQRCMSQMHCPRAQTLTGGIWEPKSKNMNYDLELCGIGSTGEKSMRENGRATDGSD
jgi:hypothetical protein